uniref:Uncharacterized protein n=1 Tax=Glossina morsitans morsitans TaxID=37546 RepID=A0A1B0FC84_GLOMM
MMYNKRIYDVNVKCKVKPPQTDIKETDIKEFRFTIILTIIDGTDDTAQALNDDDDADDCVDDDDDDTDDAA